MLANIKQKWVTFQDRVNGVILTLFMVMMSSSTAFAASGDGTFLGRPFESVKVGSAISATTIVGRLLGIISAIFILVGLFRVGTSIFSILEAYSEDNSAAMNKALKQLGIGSAFIAAPIIIRFLLG